jgi:hypothetical protein
MGVKVGALCPLWSFVAKNKDALLVGSIVNHGANGLTTEGNRKKERTVLR